MPRFHFNVFNGEPIRDLKCRELADLNEERAVGACHLADLIREKSADLEGGANWRVEIATERGMILSVLHMMAVDAPAVLLTDWE